VDFKNEDMFHNSSGNPNVMMKEKKEKPLTFMQIIDQVQKWRVIELEGIQLQPDRFTYLDRLNYFNVGMKHGAYEILFTFFLFPILAFLIPDYFLFFTGHSIGLFKESLLVASSLIPLMIYIMYCLTLTSLYTGTVTKLAIMSLLIGRTATIIMIGVFAVLFFYVLYVLSGITSIGHYFVTFFALIRYVDKLLPMQRAYYSLLFYKLIRPSFLEISIKSAIVYGISIFIPLFTVGCKAIYLKYYNKPNNKKRAH
jgi:hypothetical protein